MTLYRVTYRIVDTLVAEVEVDSEGPSIGELIEAAYSQAIFLPSIEAEIEDALDWTEVEP